LFYESSSNDDSFQEKMHIDDNIMSENNENKEESEEDNDFIQLVERTKNKGQISIINYLKK